MSPPQYRYPDSHAERALWHDKGTPEPFTPYSAEAPDALRDGLLKGWRDHMERRG